MVEVDSASSTCTLVHQFSNQREGYGLGFDSTGDTISQVGL